MLLGQLKELLGGLGRYRTSSGRTGTLDHDQPSLRTETRQRYVSRKVPFLLGPHFPRSMIPPRRWPQRKAPRSAGLKVDRVRHLKAPVSPSPQTHSAASGSNDSLHHAQTPAVLDHSCALPQWDGGAGPAFARGAVRCECNLVVLDASDVLDDALAIGSPHVDAEGEVRSRYRH